MKADDLVSKVLEGENPSDVVDLIEGTKQDLKSSLAKFGIYDLEKISPKEYRFPLGPTLRKELIKKLEAAGYVKRPGGQWYQKDVGKRYADFLLHRNEGYVIWGKDL